MRIVETTGLPSYGLKTTVLRKTTPSARASVSASRSSVSTAALKASLFIAAPSLPVPVHRAGAQYVGPQLAPEVVLDRARGFDQPPEVDSGGHVHLVQHRHEVLGGDVPRRAGRHRAPSQLAESRLERVDPLLEGREHVRQALTPRVVEVGGELDPGEALASGGEELPDLARVRHPGCVAERDLLAAFPRQAFRDLED